jgi:hypothetical protein
MFNRCESRCLLLDGVGIYGHSLISHALKGLCNSILPYAKRAILAYPSLLGESLDADCSCRERIQVNSFLCTPCRFRHQQSPPVPEKCASASWRPCSPWKGWGLLPSALPEKGGIWPREQNNAGIGRQSWVALELCKI